MVAEIKPGEWRRRPAKTLQRFTAHTLLQGRPATTGARWLNPVLFAQYALAMRMPFGKRVARPIFVLGTGRSGTTILGKVLGLHRGVCFLNEPKALWHAAIPDKRAWVEDVIGSYHHGPEDKARYVLHANDASDKLRRRIRSLYGYATTLTHSRRVCDKYPEMIFRLPFLRRLFPDASMLWLVRNGIDTLTSIDTWSNAHTTEHAGQTENWWGVADRKWRLLLRDVLSQDDTLKDRADTLAGFTDEPNRAAVEWTLTMRWGLEYQEKFSLHRVNFEDLTREPEPTLKALCRACGLEGPTSFISDATALLRPLPDREPVKLHPAIADVFDDTMHRLGYTR